MLNDINLTLQNLKTEKSQRTKNSLDKLNALLEARFNEGKQDYSIASIGLASQADGGVGVVSIRNKSGEHFRCLINAWACKAQTTMKKPPVPNSRKNETPSDLELLKRLDDPAMRAVFGQIIAENKKLKAENRILKQNTEVKVDMRPNRIVQVEKVLQQVEVLPSLDGILVSSEIDALKDAINENNILNRGWIVSRLGAVKDENSRPLFKPGFISAIQKVLAEI